MTSPSPNWGLHNSLARSQLGIHNIATPVDVDKSSEKNLKAVEIKGDLAHLITTIILATYVDLKRCKE